MDDRKTLNEETLNEFSLLVPILLASAGVILSTASFGISKLICSRRNAKIDYVNGLQYKNEESVDRWLSMNLGTMIDGIKKSGTKEDYIYVKSLYKKVLDNTEVATVKLVNKIDDKGGKEPMIFNAKAKLGDGYEETGTKLRLVVLKGAFGENGKLLKRSENTTIETINSYLGKINRIYWRTLGDSEETIERRYKEGFGKEGKDLLLSNPKQKLKLAEEAHMALDDEILLGKKERELQRKVDSFLEDVDFSANPYMIKYNKNIEILREFNYLDKISEMVRTKKYDYKDMLALREDVEKKLSFVESLNDPKELEETYRGLAKIYFEIK